LKTLLWCIFKKIMSDKLFGLWHATRVKHEAQIILTRTFLVRLVPFY